MAQTFATKHLERKYPAPTLTQLYSCIPEHGYTITGYGIGWYTITEYGSVAFENTGIQLQDTELRNHVDTLLRGYIPPQLRSSVVA